MDETVTQETEECMVVMRQGRVTALSKHVPDEYDLVGEGVGFLRVARGAVPRLLQSVERRVNQGLLDMEYEMHWKIFSVMFPSGLKKSGGSHGSRSIFPKIWNERSRTSCPVERPWRKRAGVKGMKEAHAYAVTGTIDTAIVLASSGVFDLIGGSDDGAVGPLTRVGGLTLFQRTIFTLQQAGIAQILALVGQEEQPLRSLIDGDPRIQTVIRWLPIREFPPLDPQTWETLASEIKGSCLILGCHMIFSPSLIESLRTKGERAGPW